MKTISQRLKEALWDLIGPVVLLNVGVAAAAFFKDVFLAKTLGTSPQADALSVAFFIPDAIGNNLYAYAIGVVCVPLFVRAAALEGSEFRQAVGRALASAQLGAVAILAAVVAGLPWITSWFFEGASPMEYFTRKLLWILSPTLLLFPLQAISTAALHSVGRFRRAAAAPLVFNALFLLFVLGSDAVGLSPEAAATAIACGITLSVAAGVWYVREPLLQGARELRRGAKPLPLLQMMLPFLFILLCGQAVSFAERLFAARLDDGAVAGLSYAFRLAQFPIWTLVAAVTVVILPSLAQDVSSERLDRQRTTMSRAIAHSLLCTVPISALLFLLRDPIVGVLFQRGAFDVRSAQLTAAFVEGYALSIPGQTVAAIGLRYFLARNQLKAPAWIALGGAFVTVAADAAWIGTFGPAAIGYGAALGVTLQACVYLALLIRTYDILDTHWLFQRLAELAANAPAVAAVSAVSALPGVREALSGGWGRWFWLTLLSLVYFALTVGVLRLIKNWRGVRS